MSKKERQRGVERDWRVQSPIVKRKGHLITYFKQSFPQLQTAPYLLKIFISMSP